MTVMRLSRPAKSQFKCVVCKATCLPKNGDWVASGEPTGHDVFVCRGCGDQLKRRAPLGQSRKLLSLVSRSC